jgi:hypothetical protein
LAEKVEASADITNPRDIQGILALVVTLGFLGMVGVAAVIAALRGSIQDVLAVVNVIAAPASLILGFYFGKQAAQ